MVAPATAARTATKGPRLPDLKDMAPFPLKLPLVPEVDGEVAVLDDEPLPALLVLPVPELPVLPGEVGVVVADPAELVLLSVNVVLTVAETLVLGV